VFDSAFGLTVPNYLLFRITPLCLIPLFLFFLSASFDGKHKGDFVIKVEPFENGPLFSELAFYQRVAKEEKISSWKTKHSLDYLAVPRYVASGNHQHKSMKYRFMIMDRFGEDVEKKFCQCDRKFEVKTVCTLALRLLEALEFVHSEEYVHADIKGSNLLLGYYHSEQVYLVDYGLAQRYLTDGKHRKYEEDKRRAHDGTIEFTSRDAHNGVRPSRRGDLEILGYCLVQWASGTLPWMGRLGDSAYVAKEKDKALSNLKEFLTKCFGCDVPPKYLLKYFEAVEALEYDSKPGYKDLCTIFKDELKRSGMKDDNRDLDWNLAAKGKTPTKAKSPKVLKKSPKPILELRPMPVAGVSPKHKKAAVNKKITSQKQVPAIKAKGRKAPGPVPSKKVVVIDESPPQDSTRRLRKRQPVSYVEEDTPPKRR
jgi:vaccinia related kinase